MNSRYTYLLITLIGILLFFPFLGNVHLFDWDEINFAECAREMIRTGDYSLVQINFVPFWEKPPLFIWMQVISMKIFGINEYAARFPNAICGVVTLITLYRIGSKLYNDRFAWFWVFSYTGSLLPHFYFKSGIIDPWFNLFIFLGIYQFLLFVNYFNGTSSDRRTHLHAFLSGFFIGLAVLTKGPVAVLIFMLCVGIYWIMQRFKKIANGQSILLWLGSCLLSGCSWFIYLLAIGKQEIVVDFILYQIKLFTTEDSGHGGPFLYHFIVLLAGCFPASLFALRGFSKAKEHTPFQQHMQRWMVLLFWVVLLLFSIVKTKIVHYSSLCYLPLTYLSSLALYRIAYEKLAWKKWMSVFALIFTFILGLALFLAAAIDHIKPLLLAGNNIKDPFAAANLQADGGWLGWEWLLGIFYFLTHLYFIVRIQRKELTPYALRGLLLTGTVMVSAAMLLIVPRVERYSQGAAIEFYQGIAGKKCYVEPLFFKSYAHLFYSDKPATANNSESFRLFLRDNSYLNREVTDKMDADAMERGYEDWMAKGKIDAPAYFVCKLNREQDVKAQYPQLQLLYRKNGFVFWIRTP